jgi:hypothetical protein
MNKDLTLAEKINKLNELADNSLSITRYNKHWECNSYKDGSVLSTSNEINREYRGGENFEEMIDNALEYAEKHQSKVVINGKTYRLVEEN